MKYPNILTVNERVLAHSDEQVGVSEPLDGLEYCGDRSKRDLSVLRIAVLEYSSKNRKEWTYEGVHHAFDESITRE